MENYNSKKSFTGWTSRLIILGVISILIMSIGLNFTGNIVIYAQKDKPGAIQVFFPIGDAYSEENSVRSTLFNNTVNGINIPLPSASIDHIRIDPADEATEVVITKVELRHLFGTEIYLAKDLLAHSKPVKMISSLEIIPTGLLIRTTGNDPAFELYLNKYSVLYQSIMLGIMSVILSFAVLFGVKKLEDQKARVARALRYFPLLAIPLLFSLAIATLFYPGFMSYDTLHALRSARNGVTDSMWPPMVSYVWRAVDLISLNPSAMHFSQVFLLLFSIFAALFVFTKKISHATIFLFIYLSIPVVLGTVAVIWKDVLMAAFFLAGFAATVCLSFVSNKWRFIWLSLPAVFLIFLGVCARHNAITGAVPLLFYFALMVCSRALKRPMHLWLGVILLGSVLTAMVFVTKTQLDKYSLPNFERLGNSTDVFIQSVRVLDVAGASLCVNSNLFADTAPNLSLAEIRSLYDPRHANLSKGLVDRADVYKRIDEIWLSVAVDHPICFLNNKFQLAKHLLGANEGEQFLITHPSVDNNEYGYSLPESALRNVAVAYIIHAAKLPFFKPWFLYLISIVALAYMIRVKALTAGYLTLYLSAVFYFAGLVVFGNAADARLLFYTTSALAMFIFLAIIEFKKRSRIESRL